MKNRFGLLYKLIAVLSVMVCLSTLSCGAYETVIVDFPQYEGWYISYMQKNGKETVVQFIPKKYTAKNYKESFVLHSYKKGTKGYTTVPGLLSTRLAEVQMLNPSIKIKQIKSTDVDAMAYWCVDKNAKMPAQCEIIRSTKTYEGAVTIHYVNVDKVDFKNSFDEWYKIVKDARSYYSYFRMNPVMNKATSIEL